MNHVWDLSVHYTRIKLCEFESLDAAYEASFIGADFLGFHIFSDQDYLAKAEKFKHIFSYLPANICKTLLTDLTGDTLLDILSTLKAADAIQAYAPISRQEITKLREKMGGDFKIIKLMSEKSEENQMSDDEFIRYYDDVVDAFLLDSAWIGGTGKTGNWQHCAEIVRKCQSPVFLAGGLNPDNIHRAIETVKPFGVDVENGVSDRMSDGLRVKNMLKCRLFIEKTKEADWLLHEGCR
ncbi:phosphoribosylanthranilate isomerase [Ectothiorhodospiraceae bacterium BW-2]|nr:phosphoribosylanthranilate isomerase [Ectothiorhodospiraceae bacterium BW-2]